MGTGAREQHTILVRVAEDEAKALALCHAEEHEREGYLMLVSHAEHRLSLAFSDKIFQVPERRHVCVEVDRLGAEDGEVPRDGGLHFGSHVHEVLIVALL